MDDRGKKLKLTDIQEPRLGLYKCLGEDDELIKEFDVDSSFKLKSLPNSISVDDGTKAVIECKAKTVRYKCFITKVFTLICLQVADDVTFNWFTIPEDWETNPNYVKPKPLCAKGSECSAPQPEV